MQNPVSARILFLAISLLTFTAQLSAQKKETANPPIQIAFLWHMHQPIYWPYESIIQTENRAAYSYSVVNIHTSRTGPYTSWPKDAVAKGASLPNFGAQVSLTGSLIENLNTLETAGKGFQNWKQNWIDAKKSLTTKGNPRTDLIGFGYHHPLMGLIRYEDIRKQIKLHKDAISTNFGGAYSKGIFPPENAFADRMVPALADENIEWALVDNIHFDRAAGGYPWNKGGSVVEPNKADQINSNPNDWVQLNGLWAPTKNSAKWGRQPHFVAYTNPETGETKKIIAVPTDRYLGNEDGRGGFGALNYETVMSQLESYNTDPAHPILIVLHHDGDNFGGGADYYYQSNFQAFVDWVKANPTRFNCTTVQDYLDTYPPDPNDVIHVESGSWAGADAGDPEFKKWLGDPGTDGYSPDRNSWAAVTAAQNLVSMAQQQNPASSETEAGWKYLMNAQASDYWYWDGTEMWDSHPTRGSNLAVQSVLPVINKATDQTAPTIFVPQREPYNPGGTEWEIAQPKDFTVWTYAYDFNGLSSVTLKIRTDNDGMNSPSSTDNETYSGGSEVSEWISLPMTSTTWTPKTNPMPVKIAKEYSAKVTGYSEKLLDYYVEATDSLGNTEKSVILHVWVGNNSGRGGGGGDESVVISPLEPTIDDTVTVTVKGATQGGKLHWGVNNVGGTWQTPNAVYQPAGSVLFGSGPAVQTPFSGPNDSSWLTIKIGPFNKPAQKVTKVAFVINYNDNSWDNNGGKNYGFNVSGNDTSVTPTGDSLTVHFYKPANYTNPHIYWWNAGNAPATSWPGVLMTNEGNGWYTYTLKGTKSANLIFNNGGQPQTADLTRDKEGWYYNSVWYDTKPNVVSVDGKNNPVGFVLEQNYPNPFNPTTVIRYSLSNPGLVSLQIFDILGRLIQTEVNEFQPAGNYRIDVNGKNLPSGIYYYTLKSGSFSSTKKMTVVK